MTMLKILHVEDEPDILEITTLALELDPDFEVESAPGGEAALAKLDQGEWSPDVILMDVMMPDMDGPTTVSLIRTRPALTEVPVIFITARATAEDRQRLLDLGALGVITKPFDPMVLAQNVRALLSRAGA
jgi:two-component system OmpR family response regulator